MVPERQAAPGTEWNMRLEPGGRISVPTSRYYAIYERMRRENMVAMFDERSRDGYYVSATQRSASGTSAAHGPTPTRRRVRRVPVLLYGRSPGSADFALNSSADMYAVGLKYHFSPFVSWYVVGSYLRNGPGAHYCLGVSGHGYGVCGRDANNNVVAGNKTEAVTTGMTFDF